MLIVIKHTRDFMSNFICIFTEISHGFLFVGIVAAAPKAYP